MSKRRTFAAKVAHATDRGMKAICPVCNIEIKRIKLILNKKSEPGQWTPRYAFKSICKCNEDDIYSDKIMM